MSARDLVLLGDGESGLAAHLARYGPLPDLADPAALLREVDRAGLAGRGGAGFPAAAKIAAVARAAGRRVPLVIGNGTEGEPAIDKDKMLMARSPHLVLDGAQVAAAATGAAVAVIVVHPRAVGVMRRAVSERAGDPARLRVCRAAAGFVAGEATATARRAARAAAVPAGKPPRLSDRGPAGVPTLVQNVETLAHLALIARYGADWFRSAGTADEPGTMLVTVAGAVRAPGVREIAIGTPVRQVIERAGGPSAPLRALLLGGYSGAWADAAQAMDLPLSAAGLARLGAAPGAGLVMALPAGSCGLRETARIARYLAGQSAGQCGPCVFGLDAVAARLCQLADGEPGGTGQLGRWLGEIDGRGACSHPSGVVRLVRSALRVFGADVPAHAAGRCAEAVGCPAGRQGAPLTGAPR